MMRIDVEKNRRGHNVVVVINEAGEREYQEWIDDISHAAIVGRYTTYNSTYLDGIYDGKVIKERYKNVGDDLGTSVANFKRMLDGAMYKAYIKGIEEYHNRFSSCWAKVEINGKTKRTCFRDTRSVTLVSEHREIIKQYTADGMDHMAGLGALFGKPANELKNLFGKGFWKTLCKNSKTRNDTFVRMFINTIGAQDVYFVNSIKILNTVPYTLLKELKKEGSMNLISAVLTTGINDIVKKIVSEYGPILSGVQANEMSAVINTVQDTYTMCGTLGIEFNPNWSLKRINREHDAAVKKINALTYSDEPYYWIDDSIREFTSSTEEFKAELITNNLDLANLGKQQHHCVGSYHNMCSCGHYVVYEITDKDGLVSTLGIKTSKSESNILGLTDQHYHAMNDEVIDESRINFAKNVSAKVVKFFINNVAPKSVPISKVANVFDVRQEIYRYRDIPF